MPDHNGRPYLRETRKKAEELGIITTTSARQRKAELENEFNPNLVPSVTGLTLAVSCDWDKKKILSTALDALVDANGHSEAQQLREILERIRREG